VENFVANQKEEKLVDDIKIKQEEDEEEEEE
jgi:hypothetical protein